MKKLCLSLALLSLSSTAAADEKKVKQSDVPKPVIDSVTRKYPGAKLVGFESETEEGKTSYEVKVSDGKRQIEVDCTPDGKIAAEEEKIAFEAVPEKVRQALKASPKYGSWKVRGSERVIRDEKADAPFYELVVENGKGKAELVFAADGRIEKTEEKKQGEKD
jgi:hypothetical protein